MRTCLRWEWLGKRISIPLYRPSLLRRTITTSTSSVTTPDLPKLIISPGSVHHNSLPSFLEYASRKNLAPTRTVYVGTHYEYTVALSLLRLGFSLIRTGRRADAGIDLIGHWSLPPLPEPLPIIVQCKAGSLKLEHVRELEGSFQGVPPDWRRKDVLGLLATTTRATKGVMERIGLSPWPMGFMKVTRSGIVEQFIWNRSAVEKGLEGVGVTLRHSPGTVPSNESKEATSKGRRMKTVSKMKAAKTKGAAVMKDIQLTWLGLPIFPVREDLDVVTKELGTEIGPVEPEPDIDERPKRKSTNMGTGETPRNKAGRPKGSPNKPLAEGEVDLRVLQVGRPKGSKNRISSQRKRE